jgi:copper homeostasis protein
LVYFFFLKRARPTFSIPAIIASTMGIQYLIRPIKAAQPSMIKKYLMGVY